MCYHYSPATLQRLQKLYPDKYGNLEYPLAANGFTHPELPVVTTDEATVMKWGLIPHWVKDEESSKKISKMCLNAKSETIAEKPSFRDAFNNNQRCIVPAQAFYEWRWEDEKGNKKTKYEIEVVAEEIFYFGGLYSEWLFKETGELIQTYTIITCDANELMAYIHNKKKRMPTILSENQKHSWLGGEMSVGDLVKTSQMQELDAAALQ